jgi:hypothetical protein
MTPYVAQGAATAIEMDTMSGAFLGAVLSGGEYTGAARIVILCAALLVIRPEMHPGLASLDKGRPEGRTHTDPSNPGAALCDARQLRPTGDLLNPTGALIGMGT